MVGTPKPCAGLREAHGGCQPTIHTPALQSSAKDPQHCDDLRPNYWLEGDWDGVSGAVGCAAGGLGLAAATCLRGLGFFFATGVTGSSCAMTGLGVSATAGYVPGWAGPVGGAGFSEIVCG
jgi:hypothetical protein